MDTIRLGSVQVSRLILGSNPFCGFSHQGGARDRQMMHFYTMARVKETLRQAEAMGVDTLIARADQHIIRLLMEYWDEGGRIQWVAQTCPGLGDSPRIARAAVDNGAKAVFIHGGVMDYCVAHNDLADPVAAIDLVRKAGLPVGIAGHSPRVFRWAEQSKFDVDFYMCSYYDAAPRDKSPEKSRDQAEVFRDEDRAAMTATIRTLSRPAIHYKVLAAGRNDPAAAFNHAAAAMREGDAVCVGMFTGDGPQMVAEDVRLFEQAWSARKC
jgi:hypothetical protein